MVNKCVIVGCNTGYAKKRKSEDSNVVRENVVSSPVSSFHFPSDEDLRKKWVKFVSREKWSPSSNSVICVLHFDQKYLNIGKKTKLKWDLQPVPTIYPPGFAPMSSTLPTTSKELPRQKPKERNILPDQIDQFNVSDVISNLDCLNQAHAPQGFEFHRSDDFVTFFKLDLIATCPEVQETIKIDTNLHVKLYFKGLYIPLPEWFRQGSSSNCKLTSASCLENFVSHIKNRVEEMGSNLLDEMKSLEYFKSKGRPKFSSEMIRFALMQRYTSRQAYELLIKELPLPSFSLLKKLTKGGIDPVKALKLLLSESKVDAHCVLIIDEMYLQKCVQYHSGAFVGADEDSNLYKGIVCFMIVGLRKSIPYVIKSIPEITITGEWLKGEIYESIETLSKAGFIVRAVISDNCSVNVSAFNMLKREFSPNKESNDLYIFHPENDSTKIYLFYDSVHLIKNVRNNLLSAKRFIFPPFEYKCNTFSIKMEGSEIKWSDFHVIHSHDSKLDGNLRKAPQINYQTLHPGNKKQNVQLALNIFCEETVAAFKSYIPDEPNAPEFLKIFYMWWVMSNSKKEKNTRNFHGNAAILGDKKPEYFRCVANWLEEWQKSQVPNCQKFTLTKQTCSALITTLRASANLIDDLLNEGFHFVLTARLQSDPIERRFSAYRQMSGGRFLVSLREVQSSEKIVQLKSLLKENIDINNPDIAVESSENENLQKLYDAIDAHENELYENIISDDTEEVVVYVSGYFVRQLRKFINCENCYLKFVFQEGDQIADNYLNIISRGGLLAPSESLANFVSQNVAVLDIVDKDIRTIMPMNIKSAALKVLAKYGSRCSFSCDEHADKSMSKVNNMLVNIYYNNKQKLLNADVRKDDVRQFKAMKLRKS